MTYYVSSGTLNLTKPKHWDGGLTFPIPLPLWVPVTVMRDMQKTPYRIGNAIALPSEKKT